MNPIVRLGNGLQDILDATRAIDFTAPLLLRLYLAPIFWVSGMEKALGFESIVQWFGNPDWGLGLPYPAVLAFLATASELVGAVLLLIGLATRWIAIPLMITMIVAAVTVHWEHGWQAIASAKAPFASQHLGPLAFEAEEVAAAQERLSMAKDILKEHGRWEWLSGSGSFVVLKNGIEFAATYFVMLLGLFFWGGGRYLSVDYYIDKRLRRRRGEAR